MGGLDVPASRGRVFQSLFGATEPPRTIGRYVVGERLGAGGGGVVFEAYDPDLDRTVALKLLRPGLSSDGQRRQMSARLMREARVASHVSHPNVVIIYDVGLHEDGVFVAMERLEGVDLRCWLAQRLRSWAEIRHVFLEAARGLEAVHRAGLVHRDFKPSNVFVTTAGRVCLLDFGLSKVDISRTTMEVMTDQWLASELETTSFSGTLTQTGAVVGTPRYMAPEQHDGAAAGPQADQFAFCATMFEALCGEPAFLGSSLHHLHHAKLERIQPSPPRGRAPRAAWSALRRGMDPDPAARWPSMSALREELEGLGRPRRGRAMASLSVVATIAVAVGLSEAGPEELGEPPVAVAELGTDAPPRDRGELLERQAEEVRRALHDKQFRRVIVLGSEARARAEAAGDDELELELAALVVIARTIVDPPLDVVPAAEAVFFRAAEVGRSGPAAEMASTLVYLHGAMLGESEEALRWAEHARIHLERLEPQSQSIALENNIGVALQGASHFAQARLHFERSIALGLQLGEAPEETATTKVNLASVLPELGDSTALNFTVEPGTGSAQPTGKVFATLPLV